MKDYNKKIYYSASWKDEDKHLTEYIAKLLDEQGLLLVGDHPDFKKLHHERNLDYPARVSEILESCSGLVAVLPKRKQPQTTSPYMFIEILLASKYKLPILMFVEEDVKVNVNEIEANHIELSFGEGNMSSITYEDLESNGYRDKYIEQISNLRLVNQEVFSSFFNLPSNIPRVTHLEDAISDKIQKFCNVLSLSKENQMVFNIIPFSMKESHRRIAKTVLKETGRPCCLANEKLKSDIGVREKGIQYIEEASFIISDISKLNSTCIFETGIAYAKLKDLYVVKNSNSKKLAFGLDDLQVQFYKNGSQLQTIVEEICKSYKVRVINLELSNRDKCKGLPEWYYEKEDTTKDLVILFLVIAISITMFLDIVNVGKLLSIFFGVGFGILSLLITISNKAQIFIENVIIAKIKAIKKFLYPIFVVLLVWESIKQFLSLIMNSQ